MNYISSLGAESHTLENSLDDNFTMVIKCLHYVLSPKPIHGGFQDPSHRIIKVWVRPCAFRGPSELFIRHRKKYEAIYCLTIKYI